MLKNKILWRILFFSGIIIALYLPRIFKIAELKYQNFQLEKQIAEVSTSNISLEDERERLLNDPQYIEEVAREEMNLAGKNEIVYKIVTEEK
ncbi:MAG: septum formation initiator family protein [Candidatus Omnitrophota bacterium]